MKILITGATGHIGRHILTRLHNHEVVIITRSKASLTEKNSLPSKLEIIEANLTEKGSIKKIKDFLSQTSNPIDACLHLAGESIDTRWTIEKKAQIRQSRVDSAQNLIAAFESIESKPKIFICASAIGFYGDRGSDILTEDSPPGQDFLAKLCYDWEVQTDLALQGWTGTRIAHIRMGVVLSPDGGMLKTILPLFNANLGAPLGSGHQWMGWIHIADLINIYILAIENEKVTGPINAVSPYSVTNLHFSKALAKTLNKLCLPSVPSIALKLLLGEMSSLVLNSQRVKPHKLISHQIGFNFQFDTIEKALKDLLIKKDTKK